MEREGSTYLDQDPVLLLDDPARDSINLEPTLALSHRPQFDRGLLPRRVDENALERQLELSCSCAKTQNLVSSAYSPKGNTEVKGKRKSEGLPATQAPIGPYAP
jgi:hypothetical protein